MRRPEEALHRAAVVYLRAHLPKPWLVWHTPNGGGRSKAEAGILKALGTQAGMPDLFVMGPQKAPPEHWRSVTQAMVKEGRTLEQIKEALGVDLDQSRPAPSLIAIEFKAPPKRLASGRVSAAKPRLNPAQRAVQADLGACGVPYLVIDDLEELIRALQRLGVPVTGRQP